MNQRGFTLLEVLVATLIMGIAVAGLLSGLSTSMNNAARLTDHDRAAMLARSQMEALLADPHLPEGELLQGPGWRARVTRFEMPPNPAVGLEMLERIELEVSWMAGDKRRAFTLEAFRRRALRPEDLQ